MPRRLSVSADGPRNVFGEKIREFREAAGLKRSELAAALQRAGWEIDPVLIHHIENQQRTLTDHELVLILHVLGYEVTIASARPA